MEIANTYTVWPQGCYAANTLVASYSRANAIKAVAKIEGVPDWESADKDGRYSCRKEKLKNPSYHTLAEDIINGKGIK